MMNPFRETIVADPWNSPRGDVLAIHQDVFDECLRGIEQVRRTHRSAALLIHGEAGSGKTHLLSRLRARLALQYPTATDRDEALYVWVRLQTSPRMIWRAVRRTLVNDWFRPLDGSRCQFDRILFHRLAEIRVAEGDLEPWYEYMLQEDPDGLRKLMDRIAVNLNLDRNTAVAFEHLAFDRHRRDLRAWLSGDSLPEAVLQRLELTQEEGNDEEREDQSRQVVLMLCRLAGNLLPIVLSFDQVEALETHPGDKEALFAFSQLVATVHDQTENVLIISSVQSAFAIRLAEMSRDADRDRMQSLGARTLSTLGREEGEALINARLQAYDDELPTNAEQSPLWPLSSAESTQLFANGGVTPRRLLARCAERYDILLNSPLTKDLPDLDAATDGSEPADADSSPRRSLNDSLRDQWQTTVDEKLKSNQPHQTEEILRHALPMAVNFVCPGMETIRDEQLQDMSLVLRGDSKRTGVSVCTQSNMTSLAARLRRLETQFESRRVDRLAIVRDSRVSLSPTAKKAQERLASLEGRGAVVVYPSVEVLAALDALRSLLSDAKSGDLAFHGETVSPRTLEEWLASQMPNEVQEFVEDILGRSDRSSSMRSESAAIEALSAMLSEQPIVSMQEAAGCLKQSVDEVAAIAQRHPDQFGVLGEPPTVLFRATEASEQIISR